MATLWEMPSGLFRFIDSIELARSKNPSVSEQFPSSFTGIVQYLQSDYGAISEQFQRNHSVVTERSQNSFSAVPER